MILVGAGGGSFSRPPGRSAVSCMTTLNPASGTPPSGRLRFVLVLVALIETVSTLSNLPVLYFGAPDVPGTSPGGLLISATILLSPLFAIAAEGDKGAAAAARRLFDRSRNGGSRLLLYKGHEHGVPLLERDPALVTEIVAFFLASL